MMKLKLDVLVISFISLVTLNSFDHLGYIGVDNNEWMDV